MATPADMATAASLPRVTSVRTSGDRGYIAGPGFLWTWFLVVNRMARAARAAAVHRRVLVVGRARRRSRRACRSLSAGPVGIGDPLGDADPAVVRPCHRADGLLVKPDVPIAALDRCFGTWPFGRPLLLAGECSSEHGGLVWHYVLAVNPDDGEGSVERVVDSISLGEVGGDAPVFAWDWRAETGRVLGPGDALDVDLAPHDWVLWVLAPIVDGVAVVGDPNLYATAGDGRIDDVRSTGDGRLTVGINGAAGEFVELVGWTEDEGIWRRTLEVSGQRTSVVVGHRQNRG